MCAQLCSDLQFCAQMILFFCSTWSWHFITFSQTEIRAAVCLRYLRWPSIVYCVHKTATVGTPAPPRFKPVARTIFVYQGLGFYRIFNLFRFHRVPGLSNVMMNAAWEEGLQVSVFQSLNRFASSPVIFWNCSRLNCNQHRTERMTDCPSSSLHFLDGELCVCTIQNAYNIFNMIKAYIECIHN